MGPAEGLVGLGCAQVERPRPRRAWAARSEADSSFFVCLHFVGLVQPRYARLDQPKFIITGFDGPSSRLASTEALSVREADRQAKPSASIQKKRSPKGGNQVGEGSKGPFFVFLFDLL